MHLARFPRVPAPTPLERLDNLTRRLGGPGIWIKRDDCTVLATGGNKALATAEYVGVNGGIRREVVVANCEYVGAGYGIPSDGMGKAVWMLARRKEFCSIRSIPGRRCPGGST